MHVIPLTIPTEAHVTVADMKRQLGITENDWDTELQDYIDAATEYCERKANIVSRQATYQVQLSCWPPSGELDMPVLPVREIEAVTYLDSNGDEQTVAEADYGFRRPTLFFKKTFGVPNLYDDDLGPVRVNFLGGFDAIGASGATPALQVPKAFLQAVKMLAAHYHEHRGVVSVDEQAPIAVGVADLLAQLKVYR